MRRSMWWIALVATTAVALTTPSVPAAARGVRVVRVATGLNSPVGFTFLPDGRIAYLERHTGWLRFLNPRTGTDRRIHRIQNVNSGGERGALGIAIHPGWPNKPFVYVYVTRDTTIGLRNQVLRIRVERGRGTGVRKLLSAAAGPATNHNGGRIAFGPDRELYVVIGDNADPANAQDRTRNLRGKILRMNPNGSVPDSNPSSDRIWAFGIRNSFGFAFDPRKGRLWQTENGPACNDEINLIRAGRNYGWGPSATCKGGAPLNTNQDGPRPVWPELLYEQTIGITGIAFCEGCHLGAKNDRRAFFGAVNDGRIRRAAFDARRNDIRRARVVYDHPSGVLSIEVGPGGALYFSDFGAVHRLVRT